MSKFYDEHGRRWYPVDDIDWEDAESVKQNVRTKQSFKDECDVNKILKKAQRAGGLSHVQKYPEAVYGEFNTEVDLLTAHERIGKANQIFADLPSEVRREFNNDALAFVQWAGQQPPGTLIEKIPAIAEPGRYFPNPVQRGGQGAGAATAPASPEGASSNATPEGGSSTTVTSVQGSSEPTQAS